jgi:S-(hydroxymethyl)glutathione dehydrogenase/alcohol dehydrogenase
VRPGQRVIIALTPVCGKCWFCLRQETHLCEMFGEVFARPRAERADGSVANAMSGVGSFANMMTVDEASCIPVETDLPADQLALIGCGFTTGFGAAINTAKVGPGATVAVIGCGGVGTSTIQGARVAGAAQIIAIDPLPMKRESAMRFGATHQVDPTEADPVEQVKALTGGRGVDFAFEVVGAEALQTQALQMTRRGGTTVFVGIAGGGKFVLPTLQLAMEDRTVKGSYYGSARVTRDYPRFIELIESGRVDLGGMVTKHFSLEEVNTALGAMRDGEVVRGVLMGS